MTQILKTNCDICNKELKDNELHREQQLLGLGGSKLQSKYNFSYKYEEVRKKGDLCFGCARKIRDFIEDLKEGKAK